MKSGHGTTNRAGHMASCLASAELQVSLLFLSPACKPGRNVTECKEEELAGCPWSDLQVQGRLVHPGALEESEDTAVLDSDSSVAWLPVFWLP